MRRGAALLVAALLAASAPAQADVKLGLAAPVTGPDAAFGAEMRAGVEQAVADINASGGVLGQPLVLAVGDDGSDPKRGKALASRFVGDGIRFVVGDFTSSVTLAAAEVYAPAGTLQFAPGATNPQVTERGYATIFRLVGRDDAQATVAADYLLASGKRIGLLHDRTTYGQGLADAARNQLRAHEVHEVFYDGVPAGERDLAPVLARLDAAGVEILYFTGSAAEACLLVRTARERGSGLALVGTDALASEEFASGAGAAAEGVAFTFPRDPKMLPAAADLVRRLTARNIPADPYVLLAYAAVETMRAAATSAGTLDPAAMAAALHGGTPVRTVLGPLTFDAKGDRSPPDQVITLWRRTADGRLVFGPAS